MSEKERGEEKKKRKREGETEVGRGREREIQSVTSDGDFIQFELKCGRANMDSDVLFFYYKL